MTLSFEMGPMSNSIRDGCQVIKKTRQKINKKFTKCILIFFKSCESFITLRDKESNPRRLDPCLPLTARIFGDKLFVRCHNLPDNLGRMKSYT